MNDLRRIDLNLLVILDAFGKYTHFADASRIRQWVETGKSSTVPAVALQYKADKNLKARQTGVAQTAE